MITFEIVRTGLKYVEVSWSARLGQNLTDPVYQTLAQCFDALEPVHKVEILRFSAHLHVPTPTDEVLESIKQALLENEDLPDLLTEDFDVIILPTY